ncbi:MAG: Serine/threonine-protein kinase PrkC, partial [Planctomycetota bacterium]
MQGCLWSLLSSVLRKASSGSGDFRPEDGSDLPSPPLALSSSLDGFDLLEVIGFGGFACVYRVRSQSDGRFFAIKIPRSGRHLELDLEKSWNREAEALRAISHPNIVRLIKTGNFEGLPYLVMDLVEGPNLDQWLATHRREMDRKQIVQLMLELAQGLESVHRARVLHLDFKATNILMDGSSPRISDFGFARPTRAEGHASISVPGGGTAAYMSPEQIRGDVRLGVKSDIYSLGVVYYQILTGKLPHKGRNLLEIAHSIQTQTPRWPKSWGSLQTKDLAALTLRCLDLDPENRFQSCSEIAAKLDESLRTGVIRSDRAMLSWRMKRFWKLSQPLLRKGFFTLLVLIAVIWLSGSLLRNYQVYHNREKAAIWTKLISELDHGRPSLVRTDLKETTPNTGFLSDQWLVPLDRFVPDYLAKSSRDATQIISRISEPVDEPGQYYSLQFLPGTSKFLVTTSTGKLQWWDSTNPQMPEREITASDTEVNEVIISPNGQYLCTTDDNGRARVWDSASGVCLQTFGEENDAQMKYPNLTEAVFSGDDRIVYLTRRNGEIIAWDWNADKTVWSYFTRITPETPDDTESVSIDITDQGDLILLTTVDGHLRWIGTEGGELLKSVKLSETSLGLVRIHGPQRKALVELSRSELGVVDIGSGHLIHFISLTDSRRNMSPIDEARNHFFVTNNEMIEQRHWPSLALEKTWVAAESRLWDFAVSPDQTFLLTTSRDSTLRRIPMEQVANQWQMFDSELELRPDMDATILVPVGLESQAVVGSWSKRSSQLILIRQDGQKFVLNCPGLIISCVPVELWGNHSLSYRFLVGFTNGSIYLVDFPIEFEQEPEFHEISEFQIQTGTDPQIKPNQTYDQFVIVSDDEQSIDILKVKPSAHQVIRTKLNFSSGLRQVYWSNDGKRFGHSNGQLMQIYGLDDSGQWYVEAESIENNGFGILPLGNPKSQSVVFDRNDGWTYFETAKGKTLKRAGSINQTIDI